MPILKNPRHERFAQELASGKHASEAYVIAGYKANDGNASTLKSDQRVSKRVEELLATRARVAEEATHRAIERTAINKEWVMGRLRENVERAMTVEPVLDRKGKPTGEYRYDGAVANRALELLGREIGMFIERREIGKPNEFAALSDRELADRIVSEMVANGIAEDVARQFVESRQSGELDG